MSLRIGPVTNSSDPQLSGAKQLTTETTCPSTCAEFGVMTGEESTLRSTGYQFDSSPRRPKRPSAVSGRNRANAKKGPIG